MIDWICSKHFVHDSWLRSSVPTNFGQDCRKTNEPVEFTSWTYSSGRQGWEVGGEREGYLHVGLVLGRDVGLLLAVRLEFGLQLLQRFLNRGLQNHQNDITPGLGSSKLDLPNPGLSRSLLVYLYSWVYETDSLPKRLHCEVENQTNGPGLSSLKHMQFAGSWIEMKNFTNPGLA